jgi:hypothetical protein
MRARARTCCGVLDRLMPLDRTPETTGKLREFGPFEAVPDARLD